MLLLFAAMSSAAVFNTYSSVDNSAHVNTQISLAASLSSAQAVYCTNANIQLSGSISARWKTTDIDGASLAAGFINWPKFNGQQTYNHSVKFILPDKYSILTGKETQLFSSQDWLQFTNSVNGVPMYAEGFTYVEEEGNNYLVHAAAICKAPVSLMEYVNDAPQSLATLNYAGGTDGQIDFANLNSGNSERTRTFSMRVDKSCLTAVNNSANLVNINKLGHANVAVDSAQYRVAIENPFSCQLQIANPSLSPATPLTPGQNFTLAFDLVNRASKPIRADSIALTRQSGQYFGNARFTLPQGDIAVGASGRAVMTGNVSRNLAPGTYQINLAIATHSTANDCTGRQNLACNNNSIFTVNVLVVPAQTCNLSFAGGNGNLLPGQIALMDATCANPATCPPLAWSHNAGAAASISPANTPQGANPRANLTIAQNAQQHNGYRASARNGTLDCAALLFNILPPAIPSNVSNYVIVGISFPDIVYVGETFPSNITTWNKGNASNKTSTTNVSFLASWQNISVPALAANSEFAREVRFNCSQAGSGIIAARADSKAEINESNETDNALNATVVCNRKPTNCSLAFSNHPANFTANDSAAIIATCRDAQGALPCPMLDWSQNATGEVSLSPIQTPRAANPSSTLTIGEAEPQIAAVRAKSNESGFPLVCAAVSFNITSRQAPELPNFTIECGSFQMVLVGGGDKPMRDREVEGDKAYIPLPTGPVVFPGQEWIARANCTNSEGASECPALKWSVSIAGAAMLPNQTQSGVSPQSMLRMPNEEPNAILPANVTMRCANPFECIAYGQCPFSFSPTPRNMSCSFLNHGTSFAQNDSAILQANCMQENRRAECPALNWETNITNASFSPNPTASGAPATNFSTRNSPAPQYGYASAQSATAGIQLQCEIPVSVQNAGPDYAVMWVRAPPYMLKPNENFTVGVNIANIGNRNVSINTLTTLLSENCSALAQSMNTPGLAIGKAATMDFTCTCGSSGTRSITAVADSSNQVAGDLNRSNNVKSATYICGVPYAPVCADWI